MAKTLEEKIAGFVDEILRVDPLEGAFNLHIVHDQEVLEAKLAERSNKWIALLQECSNASAGGAGSNGNDPGGGGGASSQNQIEQALKYFVASATSPARQHKFQRRNDRLIDLLEESVAKRVVGARQVCDAILNSDQLKPERVDFWVAAFSLVRRIVGGVDYKGVREIMKICVDKVIALPSAHDPGCAIDFVLESQLSVVHNLLAYIFNRNAALLPGYFIVNEILKVKPLQNRLYLHFKSIVRDYFLHGTLSIALS